MRVFVFRYRRCVGKKGEKSLQLSPNGISERGTLILRRAIKMGSTDTVHIVSMFGRTGYLVIRVYCPRRCYVARLVISTDAISTDAANLGITTTDLLSMEGIGTHVVRPFS